MSQISSFRITAQSESAVSLEITFSHEVGDLTGVTAHLLDGIPVSVSFDEPTDVDVLSFVVEKIHEHTPLRNVQATDVEEQFLRADVDEEDVDELLSPGILKWVQSFSPYARRISEGDVSEAEIRNIVNKEFTRNRHTLTDVLSWLCEITESRWWFDYDDENNTPVLAYDTSNTTTTYYDTQIADDDDPSI